MNERHKTEHFLSQISHRHIEPPALTGVVAPDGSRPERVEGAMREDWSFQHGGSRIHKEQSQSISHAAIDNHSSRTAASNAHASPCDAAIQR